MANNNLLNNILNKNNVSYGKSYEEIFNDTITYLQSINPRWTNLVETDLGVMMVHAIAYMSTLNNYYLDRSVQELHPDYASEDVSKYAISNFLGYRRPGIKASTGVVRMYLLSNIKVGDHMDIPKYFPFVTRNGQSAQFMSATNTKSFDLSRLPSLLVVIPEFNHSDTTVRHPVIYLEVYEGAVKTYTIIDAGTGLDKYANTDLNIKAYVNANPNMELILVIRDGSVSTVILNSDYQKIDESGVLNSKNAKLLLPYVDIDVTEGTPTTSRISESQISNNEYDTGLTNIDLNMLELYDKNGNLWTRVDNILYEYDQYGLNPRKYSVRFSSTNTMIVEFNTDWGTQVPKNSDYAFLLRYLVSSTEPADILPTTPVVPYNDIELSWVSTSGTSPLSLSAIHSDSRVVVRVTGGTKMNTPSEDLLLARIQSRTTKTIVTVPDLAGVVRGYKQKCLSVAADINDEEEVRNYIQRVTGNPVETYKMYYSIVDKDLNVLSPHELDKLYKYVTKYKHIFTKDFIYVKPEFVDIDIKLNITYASDYEDPNLKSNIMNTVKTMFSTSYNRFEFNSIPNDSEIIAAIHNLSGSVINVQVEKTTSAHTRHLFTMYKLDELDVKISKIPSSQSGGYRYDKSQG